MAQTSYKNRMTKSTCMAVYTYVHGKNKSRHHAFSSGKHAMQNAARCRDTLTCMIHAQVMLHCVKSFLVSVLFMEHELGNRLFIVLTKYDIIKMTNFIEALTLGP